MAKKYAFINGNFPVEDLRFGEIADDNFQRLEESQRDWGFYQHGEKIGDLFLESTIDNARVTFRDTLQEFADADEAQRKCFTMEAVLYRSMITWDTRPADEQEMGKKVEFLTALNGFLGRNKNAALEIARENGLSITDAMINDYQPDALDLEIRDLVDTNKTLLSSADKKLVASINGDLQRLYMSKNDPHYSNAVQRAVKNWTEENVSYGKMHREKHHKIGKRYTY